MPLFCGHHHAHMRGPSRQQNQGPSQCKALYIGAVLGALTDCYYCTAATWRGSVLSVWTDFNYDAATARGDTVLAASTYDLWHVAAAWGGLNCLHVTTDMHRVNRPPALEDGLASLSRRSSLLPHDKGVLLDTLPWGARQPSPSSTRLPAPRRRTLQVGCGLALQGLLQPSREQGTAGGQCQAMVS